MSFLNYFQLSNWSYLKMPRYNEEDEKSVDTQKVTSKNYDVFAVASC